MIQTKSDLKFYLHEDAIRNGMDCNYIVYLLRLLLGRENAMVYRYLKSLRSNALNKLPGISKVFFNENDDSLERINEKMENLIEEMGNSKNKKVIISLNEFPVLSTNATTSPFKRRWLNILSIAIFPIGIIIYLRSLKFRRRLVKDLTRIESNTKNIINILKEEKLI